MQKNFSDLEYAAKGKVSKRGRLLGELEAITPWSDLLSALGHRISRRAKGAVGRRLDWNGCCECTLCNRRLDCPMKG